MTGSEKLSDAHRRTINYLRISITDRCNLRCVYCMPEEGIELLDHREILSFEEIVRVAEAAVKLGFRKLRITGGEPLVRRDAVELIGRLVKIPGVEDVGLTTNGILLAQKVDELCKAGLRRINVSLDSLDPAKFREITRGGDIQKVLAGIDAALERGLHPVKVNVVAFRGLNDGEVAAFGRMTIERPLRVRFIEHMPMEHSSMGPFLPEREILERLRTVGQLEEIEREQPGDTARRFKYRGGEGEVGLISPISNKFCDNCNRLRLNADGALQSCLLHQVYTDIKSPLRNGVGSEELMELLRTAAKNKPSEHSFDPTGIRKCARAMPIVGG